MTTKKCEQCECVIGKSKNGKYNKRFCSHVCKVTAFTGANNPLFKTGKTITRKGYVVIQVNGRQWREHRWIMQNHLRRPLLPSESVHHINGIKHDNRIENLEILDSKEHCRIHGFIKSKNVINKKVSFEKPNKIGLIFVDKKDDYRSYKSFECLNCKNLWWSRKKSNPKFCSQMCLEKSTNRCKTMVKKYRWNKN